jgi:hypothetical protein
MPSRTDTDMRQLILPRGTASHPDHPSFLRAGAEGLRPQTPHRIPRIPKYQKSLPLEPNRPTESNLEHGMERRPDLEFASSFYNQSRNGPHTCPSTNRTEWRDCEDHIVTIDTDPYIHAGRRSQSSRRSQVATPSTLAVELHPPGFRFSNCCPSGHSFEKRLPENTLRHQGAQKWSHRGTGFLASKDWGTEFLASKDWNFNGKTLTWLATSAILNSVRLTIYHHLAGLSKLLHFRKASHAMADLCVWMCTMFTNATLWLTLCLPWHSTVDKVFHYCFVTCMIFASSYYSFVTCMICDICVFCHDRMLYYSLLLKGRNHLKSSVWLV